MIVVEELHHITIPSTDIEKSIEFYTMLFDFDRIEEEGSIVRFDNVTIQFETSASPSNHAVISFLLDVDDFTDALQELEEKTIEIVKGPDETEKGEEIQIKDPGGNIISLFYQE